MVMKSIRKGIDERIESEPTFFSIVTEALHKLTTGFWNQAIVDVIMQKHWSGGKYDIYDAAIFAEIWSAMCENQILGCPISIDDTPHGDKAEKENNKILTTLHEPFYAEFHGGCGDNDGHLGWYDSIEIASLVHGDGPNNMILSANWGKEIGVPLEVGFTHSHTTLFHLMSERCLARWPYGSKIVWLLWVVDEKLWRFELNPPFDKENPFICQDKQLTFDFC